MIDSPQILKTVTLSVAVIHLQVPRAEMQKVMGPAFAELEAAVARQGVRAQGPRFTHHLKMDPASFDFEAGVPVSGPVTAEGRVKPGQLRNCRAARTVYRGGYEGLGEAWGKLRAWMEEEGHTATPDLWECYLAGPESSSDPASWCTELTQPVTIENKF